MIPKPWLTIELRNPPCTLTNWRALPLALLYAPFLLFMGLVVLLGALVVLPVAWGTGRLKVTRAEKNNRL